MRPSLLIALLVMGLTSVAVQVVVLRELLVNFLGNELSVGVILANWLLLEALGSWLMGRASGRVNSPVTAYVTLQVAIAALLPLVVWEARMVRSLTGLVPGEGIGLPSMGYLSFIMLAPLALSDGAQFTLGCRIFSQGSGNASMGLVYVLEAIGSVIGGMAATYVFVPWVPSMATAFAVGGINLLAAFLLLNVRPGRHICLDRPVAILAAVAVPYILISSQAGSIERATLEARWRGYELLESKNSVYGNIAVIGQANQTTFFVDGVPVVTSPVPDLELAGDLVHLSFLCHGSPKRVLIIGGGASGLVSEALRHDVEEIVYVEQDPLLIQLVLNMGQPELQDPSVRIEETDGRKFLAGTDEEFDVILVDLPYPSSLVLNRFYTVEFFALVSARLADGGVLSFPVPGSSGYLSEEERKMNLCVLKSLDDAFEHVRVVPGTPNLLMASNETGPPEMDAQALCERSRSLGLEGIMPCQRLEYLMNEDRENWFWDSLADIEARANMDLRPSGVFYSLSYWTSIFSPGLIWAIRIAERVSVQSLLVLLGAITLMMLPFRRRLHSMGLLPIPLVVASTGFFGMGFNIMIMLTYQSLFGYLYHEIGLILMAFMLGLSVGSLLSGRYVGESMRHLVLLETLMIAFSLAFMAIVPGLVGPFGRPSVERLFLLGLSSASGLLVGAEFSVSSRLRLVESRDLGRAAGSVYAWDLGGAVLASLIISVVLIPLLGVTAACTIILAVKVAGLALAGASCVGYTD